MKTLVPYRTAVASFSSSSSPQHRQQGFEYDGGEYILSLASPASPAPSDDTSSRASTCVAAALSDRSLALYDATAGQVSHRIPKAHDGPISEVQFLPGASSLLSASQDGTVKLWDARSNSKQSAIAMKLALPKEQALSVSVGYGGTLAAVGTSAARISFFDLRMGDNHRPSGNLMGNSVDAHTEEVTKVRFQTIPSPQSNDCKTALATASEDGLVVIHDPSQPSEEAALLSVLNIGAPLRDVGFFGPSLEGLYALTGNETMSVHHWDSAQKVSDVGGMGLRGLLSDAVDTLAGKKSNADAMDEGRAVEYLVGCTWASVATSSPALYLLAGNSEGDGYVFQIDADRITPLMHLKGGHRGCIRDFCWIDDGSGGRTLVTGGEDARLCEWDLSGKQAAANFHSGKKDRSHKGGGPVSGRSLKSAGSSSGDKGKKKKFGSPY
ncbi:hypothetical protein ACHAXT_006109 [Thalassiosira profunda]